MIDQNALRRLSLTLDEIHWLEVGGSVAVPDFGVLLIGNVEVLRIAKDAQIRVHGGVKVARPPKKERV